MCRNYLIGGIVFSWAWAPLWPPPRLVDPQIESSWSFAEFQSFQPVTPAANRSLDVWCGEGGLTTDRPPTSTSLNKQRNQKQIHAVNFANGGAPSPHTDVVANRRSWNSSSENTTAIRQRWFDLNRKLNAFWPSYWRNLVLCKSA